MDQIDNLIDNLETKMEAAEAPLSAEDRSKIEERLAPRKEVVPTYQEPVEFPPESSAPVEGMKKKSKNQLVDDVMEASRRTGVEVKSEKTLKRMTKDELRRLLGSIVDRGISKAKTWDNPETVIDEVRRQSDNAKPSDNTPQGEKPKAPEKLNISLDVGAKSLFQLNKLLSQVVENVGEYYSDETGVTVKGYTDDLDRREEELMEYYKQIYAEYGQDLAKYVSPVNMVILINTQCIASNVVKAEAKKQGNESDPR